MCDIALLSIKHITTHSLVHALNVIDWDDTTAENYHNLATYAIASEKCQWKKQVK